MTTLFSCAPFTGVTQVKVASMRKVFEYGVLILDGAQETVVLRRERHDQHTTARAAAWSAALSRRID